MTRSILVTAVLLSGCLAGLFALAACDSHPSAGPQAGTAARARAAVAAKVAASQAATRKAAAAAKPRASITQLKTADGSAVTVAIFRGALRYVLHDGSEDPHLRPGAVRAGSVVAGAEREHLLAAFNGGFKMAAGAGGFEQEGHVFYPLSAGFASLVIDRSGQARIGVWDDGVPTPGEQVYSVRQNLRLLVMDGKPTAAAYDWAMWGATLGGGEYVARSAVGQDAAGDLIYVGSMSTTPSDLAQVLARSGARTGMELDINPAWVQLDIAREPGGSLRAEIPGQIRSAAQFVDGWSRDFFTVLTAAG